MSAVATAPARDLRAEMAELGAQARTATAALARASADTKNKALREAARALRRDGEVILAANAEDMAAAEGEGLSAAKLDRLALNESRVEAMARGLEEIAALADPIGEVIAEWSRPNGLRIQRLRVPLGVIGVIYESRPNVTADAGGLCLKSGNVVILRGGSESFHSATAILACLQQGLVAARLPQSAIQMVPTRDRAAVGAMVTMNDYIDVIVPRGGKSLIERVMAETRIPVVGHLEGICHVYVDGAAKAEMARDIVFNAKMRRTGVCGAAETLLVDRRNAAEYLPVILEPLFEAGCEIRGDNAAQAIDRRVRPATSEDWGTEYLDAILSVKVVDGVDEAIAHIARHGSHHTDSIVTSDKAAAAKFLAEVDSGIVLHNASTQFADGGEFGMGAEIGISTSKLHARGPVGVEQLTSYKYVVRGDGQLRS